MGLAESVSESDLIGTWQFVGGGEIMGYGFRLNTDGTGVFLDTDAVDMGMPKHWHSTGNPFTWHIGNDVFSYTADGNAHIHYVSRYEALIFTFYDASDEFKNAYNESSLDNSGEIQANTKNNFK